jgi:hypothetical protein
LGHAGHYTGMDRQYIRDHQVVERYLTGTLTADEEQAFEEAYLGDSELLNKLQAAERLRDGLKQADAAGRLALARRRAPWSDWLASPGYAAAASVLLAVSLGFSTVLYRENRDLREGGLSSGSVATRFVALEATRGAGAITIPQPEQDEWTALLVDSGTVAYDTYRGTLTRNDGSESQDIWSRGDLVPELGGTIVIGVPGRALRPGSYEARLEGRMSDWSAERFEEVSRTQLRVTARE